MISGLVTASLPAMSACDVSQPGRSRRPADGVVSACLLALETPLHQHEAGAAGRRFETHHDLGLVAACAALVFPGPGENQMPRRLNHAVDAACCQHAAVGPAQGGTPAAPGSGFEKFNRGFIAIRRPPSKQLSRLGPEREQNFGRQGDQPLEAQRGLAQLSIAHDFFRLGVCAAAGASSRSRASVQCRRCPDTQLSTGTSASARTRTNRHCRSIRRSINPARSNTCKCRVIAGPLMANGAATSPTLSSPVASSRSMMARRVGSASAANRLSSCGTPAAVMVKHSYLIYLLIYRIGFSVNC